MPISSLSLTTGEVSPTSSEGDNLDFEVKDFQFQTAQFSDQKTWMI